MGGRSRSPSPDYAGLLDDVDMVAIATSSLIPTSSLQLATTIVGLCWLYRANRIGSKTDSGKIKK